jgi:hypothetical protein
MSTTLAPYTTDRDLARLRADADALTAERDQLREDVALLRKRVLVYLAIPYSHPDPGVREWRFRQANTVSAQLMGQGHKVFSPITHTHPIAVQCGLPLGFDFWQEYDEAILAACAEMVVITLDGWQQSKGVQGEMEIAKRLGIPIRFMEAEVTSGRVDVEEMDRLRTENDRLKRIIAEGGH